MRRWAGGTMTAHPFRIPHSAFRIPRRRRGRQHTLSALPLRIVAGAADEMDGWQHDRRRALARGPAERLARRGQDRDRPARSDQRRRDRVAARPRTRDHRRLLPRLERATGRSESCARRRRAHRHALGADRQVSRAAKRLHPADERMGASLISHDVPLLSQVKSRQNF